MAVNYTYTITKIFPSEEEVNGFSDVILQVAFDITATDTETNKTGVFSGSWSIQPPEENYADFTPYADLTEQQVLTWLHNNLGDSRKEIMEQNAVKNMSNEKSLPW